MADTEPPGDGWDVWAPWDGRRSGVYDCELVELWRPEWADETQFAQPNHCSPYMNVAGLYWRKA